MADVLYEPIELTAAELDAVAGGVAIAENVSSIVQANANGNKSVLGGVGATNLNLGIVTQTAFAFNFL